MPLGNKLAAFEKNISGNQAAAATGNNSSMTTAGLVAMRSSCPREPTPASARRTQAAEDGVSGVEVLKPGHHDVLLGRGGGARERDR